MIIAVSLLVCIIGAFVNLAASSSKVQELGRLAFGCGLLTFLLRLSGDFLTIAR